METNNEGLQKWDPQQFAVIISGVPGILEKNTTSVERARSAVKALLDTIEAEGMTDALDIECNKLLVKLRITGDNMYNDRQAFTQLLDALRTKFTSLEKLFDPKNKDGFYLPIQKYRDDYATQKAKEQREKEQAAQRKLELDKELIRLKSECQLQLATYFNNFISNRISKLNELFNSVTLDDYEVVKKGIGEFSENYSHDHFDSFEASIRPIYASSIQVKEIKTEVRKGKFGELADEYRAKISETKLALLDKLPSRNIELEEIARQKKINADKAAQMELEAKEREKKEKEKRDSEELQRQKAAESKIATEAQASTTQSLFDAQVTIAEAPQQSASVRESYEIEVINPLGYSLIAAFYFEKEGKTEKLEKLEKKTLGSMKKFAESYAIKHDEKINSPFLKYMDKFKTLARK